MLQDGMDQQRISAFAAVLCVAGAGLLTGALFLSQTEDANPYLPFGMVCGGAVILLAGITMSWYRQWRNRA